MSNNGSDQKASPDSLVGNRLSLDRTFLMWLQTGIGMISLGIAFMDLLPKVGFLGTVLVQAISVALIVEGVFVAFSGVRRYVREAELLAVPGQGHPTHEVVIAAALAAVIGLIAILSVVL